MEYLIIILVVSMLYFIIPSRKELLSDEWDGSDIDGGMYGTKPKPVKKKTRKRTKALPKKVVKKRKATKRKPKK